MTDFILFNKTIAEDLIKNVFRTTHFDNLREFPYILAENDVGDPEKFLDYIDDRLNWLCFDLRAHEFITIEKEYIPIFNKDEVSDSEDSDEDSDDEEVQIIIPPTKFKDIPKFKSSLVPIKVKHHKLNLVKKKEKVEEKEDDIKLNLNYDEWTKKEDICSLDFTPEKVEKVEKKKEEKPKPKKTRMCPFGDKCKKFKKGTCNFAHDRSELVKKKKYTDSSDVLGNHFNLLFENLQKSKPKPKSKPKENISPLKTRMCRFKNKCNRPNCTFAHTIDEWNPIICSFDGRCKNDNCKFWHKKTETKEQLCIRIN